MSPEQPPTGEMKYGSALTAHSSLELSYLVMSIYPGYIILAYIIWSERTVYPIC